MKRFSSFWVTPVWALQFWIVLAGTRYPTYAAAFRSFKRWDSIWYEAIADYGYWPALPYVTLYPGAQTVAWFPAYPLAGRAFGWLFRVDTQTAMMLTAASFSLVFWLYVAAIFERLVLRWPFKVLAVCLIMAHPSAFFMFSEYSESLFMASVLGFCYWASASPADRPASRGARWSGPLFTAIHGFVASATRLIGIPLAALPVAADFFWPDSAEAGGAGDSKALRSGRLRGLLRSVPVSVVCMSGGLAFFAFLQARFGNWRLYLDTQTRNWGIHPDYGAILAPSSYAFCTANLEDSGCLSKTSVPLTMLLILAASAILILAARGKARGSKRAFLLLGSSWICFAVSLAGLASRQMLSMIRYTFPPYAFAILAIAVCAAELRVPERLKRHCPFQLRMLRGGIYAALIAAVVVLLRTQLLLIHRFVNWSWVA